MSKRIKPTVKVNCVANHYTAPNERIIEYTFPDGTGGLIAFFAANEHHGPIVNLYCHDRKVEINIAKEA